ncbi:MAG: hypothetical protein GKS04_05900 [Candidatus Mycalebacterium zealandia]|nr:MAG: hypothetical protein GKS04_05900 [Candidatus Mycalebacterium zealandia]
MAKLIADVIENYIDILSNTIPRMVSGARAEARFGIYCAAVVLYPLALVVLFVLVMVAVSAVFIVHPLITGSDRTPSP